MKANQVTGGEESGGEARVYYIDADKVLKVQRPHRVSEETSQEREVMFLNEVNSFSEITMPEVFGYGRENDTIEYKINTMRRSYSSVFIEHLGNTGR